MNRERPNVLVIMADQLRRVSLSCYGDPNIQTPNIDALAQAGVRFTQASSTYPVCVPARFSFITGEYAHSRYVPSIEWRMSPAETTLADYFNAADYHTCYIGKWHLYGGHGVLPDHTNRKANRTPVPPAHQGRWQKWLGFDLANAPWDTCYFEDDDPSPRKLDGYQTNALTDLALDYLRSREETDTPFCCVLSVEPPHFPMEAPPELEQKWLNRELILPENFLVEDPSPPPCGNPVTPDQRDQAIEHIQRYYAMVENLDQNVGRLLTALHENQLDENTVVLFFSDHGEMQGAHCQLSAIKHHPYEESVGIPVILCDPRLRERAGSTVATPACMEDILPTLLGQAGLDVPTGLPGCDLSPLVRGEADSLPRPGVMLEYVHDFRESVALCYHRKYWRGFRSERYKYTVLGDAAGCRPWQFFNLQEDPLEMKNLIESPEQQDLIAQHHQWLRERMIETSDHFVLSPLFGQPSMNLVPNND